MTAGWSSFRLAIRPKKKFVLALVFIFVLFFFLYQMMFISLLDDSQSKSVEAKVAERRTRQPSTIAQVFDQRRLVRGTRDSDFAKYKPDSDEMFTCFSTSVKIPFSWVNDDYCDCPEDGTDEPGTNACNNGHFYCLTRTRKGTSQHSLPSSRVNDGICDCCDGTDEWNVSDGQPTHCPNVCMRSRH